MAAPTNDIAFARLTEEYKKWQVVRPKGFEAQVTTNKLTWHCQVPLAEGATTTTTTTNTIANKGSSSSSGNQSHNNNNTVDSFSCRHLSVDVEFPRDYPHSPPRCTIPFPLTHPNVHPSGTVDLPLLQPGVWRPQVTAEEVLVALGERISNPDFGDPCNAHAVAIHSLNAETYRQCLAKALQLGFQQS